MPNPAQRRRPNRVLPPSGAAQAVFCDFLEENLRPKLADQSDETVLFVDSDSEATQDDDIAVIADLVEFYAVRVGWGGGGRGGEAGVAGGGEGRRVRA